MATTETVPSLEQQRAEEVYDRLVHPILRPEDDGKYVAVAYELDDFEVHASDYEALERLHARHPGGGASLPDEDREEAGVQAWRSEHQVGQPVTARGTVNSLFEPVLHLRVRGPNGDEAPIDAVVDTGYTGWLTLTDPDIVALGLVWRSVDQIVLADGSALQIDTYKAEVEWGNGTYFFVTGEGARG